MMTTHHDRHYKAGGDPRTLADFMALRAEMNKLSHPARPDINWPYAEQLARGLLEHHGADLQTVAWYTLARARLGGVAGINEGLTADGVAAGSSGEKPVATALPARTEIFRTLSKRLRQVIRTLNITPEDVESLEQAERSLQSFDAVLQRLEIAPENQLSDLRALLHSTATRFESLDPAPALPTAPPVAVSDWELPGTLVSEEDAAKVEPVPDLKRRPKAETAGSAFTCKAARAGGGVYSGNRAALEAVYRRNGYHAGGNGYRRRRMAGAASVRLAAHFGHPKCRTDTGPAGDNAPGAG